MGFFLFILVNAALFIRPGEIVKELDEWSVYQWLILACLVASYSEVVGLLSGDALAAQPITVCVLGVWAIGTLSHLTRMATWEARTFAFEFGKVLLYYLLFVALVDSSHRLRQFMMWTAAFITILAALAILQYHEVIHVPGMSTLQQKLIDPDTGELEIVPRLRSTGMFNDPNDLCLVLVLGTLVALYLSADPRNGLISFLWLGPVGLFGYSLFLTRSRGGLLGFLIALFVLCRCRLGWMKTLLLSGVLAPLLFLGIGGRQASFNVFNKEDTGQQRVVLWAEGFSHFRESPIFGIGPNNYVEVVGKVAHNSYIHGFVELGIVGGTLFVGAFCLGLWQLERLGSPRTLILDPNLRRLRPYLMAILAGYGGGLLTLSRNYGPLTYLILGLVCAYVRQAHTFPALRRLEFDGALIRWFALVGLLSVVVIYLTIKLFVRW